MSTTVSTTPLNSDAGNLAERALTAIIEQPERGLEITRAYQAISNAARIVEDRKTRRFGMKLAAALSLTSIMGALFLAGINGSPFAQVALYSIASACAGGILVLASGNKLDANGYRNMSSGVSNNKSTGESSS